MAGIMFSCRSEVGRCRTKVWKKLSGSPGEAAAFKPSLGIPFKLSVDDPGHHRGICVQAKIASTRIVLMVKWIQRTDRILGVHSGKTDKTSVSLREPQAHLLKREVMAQQRPEWC